MAIPVVIALVVGFVSLFLLKRFLVPSKRLPPGPRPLPILGNLLLLKKFATIQDLANELRRIYGPIVTLWMGSRPTIIISGQDIIQEAMITQGNIYSGRAHFESTAIINNHHRGLLTGVGERQRFFRKLVVSDILSNSRVTGFRPIRDNEGDILIDNLKKQARENGGILTGFRLAIHSTTCNLLLGICFDRRLNVEDFIEMEEVMAERFRIAAGKPRDFIPLLKLFPDKKGYQRQMTVRTKFDEFLKPLIEDRKRLLSSGKALERPTFVDRLFGLQSGQQKFQITDEDVVSLCQDVVNAGTDTTSLNMEYIVANLINNPEIQERLYEEIFALVGEKKVDEDDIPRLPYLQAVVKEGLRRHSPGRLAVPRAILSPSKLAGYDIPANALVFQHVEGVALNPEIHPDPLEFRPERFLNKSVDNTGSTEITLIPFGVGRRICPAINIAFLHAHFILARLIQAFEWKLTTYPGQLLDLTPGIGMASPMNHPLKAILRER